MAKTTAQLATRVLNRIGTLAEGAIPSTSDANRVTSFYSDIYQELEREDIAFWDETSIPEYVFQALVDYLAGLLSPDDGWPRPDLSASGYERLKRASVEPGSGEDLAPDYF